MVRSESEFCSTPSGRYTQSRTDAGLPSQVPLDEGLRRLVHGGGRNPHGCEENGVEAERVMKPIADTRIVRFVAELSTGLFLICVVYPMSYVYRG